MAFSLGDAPGTWDLQSFKIECVDAGVSGYLHSDAARFKVDVRHDGHDFVATRATADLVMLANEIKRLRLTLMNDRPIRMRTIQGDDFSDTRSKKILEAVWRSYEIGLRA